MSRDCRVVAIVAAYNEEDVVEQVLSDLIAQHVEIYFLDDGSTDGTRAVAEKYLGRGVIGVEQVHDHDTPSEGFSWTKILTRKESLAEELDADWFVHHDADEFRESPWPELTLAQAIARADREGYNAIDFALLDFWPTDDRFSPGNDVRDALQNYEAGAEWNRVQIKCWKKQPRRIDLVTSGGHEAAFEHRRVYPLRFVLRHYPIRNTAHGRRKVFQERLPRFSASERARGWHVQYDAHAVREVFTRDPADVTRYEPFAVRLSLASQDALQLDQARERAIEEGGRLAEELRQACEERDVLDRARAEEIVRGQRLATELKQACEERDALDRARAEEIVKAGHLAEDLGRAIDAISQRSKVLDAVREERRQLTEAVGRLQASADSQADTLSMVARDRDAVAQHRDALARELEAMRSSRTWRWTRFVRLAFELLKW